MYCCWYGLEGRCAYCSISPRRRTLGLLVMVSVGEGLMVLLGQLLWRMFASL